MDNQQNKRRGRPPKDAVHRLCGQIMVSVVMARLGVKSVYGLARALFPEYAPKSAELETVERTWRRYAVKGVRPSAEFKDTESALRAEKKAPGCLRCVDSLAWKVLKGAEFERLRLLGALRSLPLHIRGILFDPNGPQWEGEPALREFNGTVAEGIEALTGFEAIETFVLLAAYARAIQSEKLCNAVTFTYMERRPVLAEDRELAAHFRELFTVVDRHMPIWMHTSPTNRFDVFAPWQGQMPEKVIADPNQPPSLLELAEIALKWEGEPIEVRIETKR